MKLHRYLILIALFFSLIDPHAALCRDTITLQLRWDNQFQFAGYYAADWLGYYDEANIDVIILPAVKKDMTILSATQEVTEGRADFGIGGADILTAYDKGADLQITASIFQQSATAFYSLQSTPLDSLADLAHLRVSRIVDSLLDIEFQSLLISEGIDPKNVPAFPHKPGLHYLVSQQTDVIPGYSISLPYEAQELGLHLHTLKPSSYGIDFYGDSLFTSGALTHQNPELVTRFTEASLKGWEYALSHKAEIVERIITSLPRIIPVLDLEAFNTFQSERIPTLIHQDIVELGHVNPDRWAKMYQYLQNAGIVKTPQFKVEDVIFDSMRTKLRIEEKQHNIFLSLLMFALSSLCLGLIFVIFLRKTVQKKTKELKLANTELKNKEERLQQFSKATDDGICIASSATIIATNSQFDHMFGYAENELLEKNVKTIVTSESQEIVGHHIENEISAPYEAVLLRKDDTTFLAEVRGRTVSFKGETVRETVIKDITKKKEIEKILVDTQNELTVLFQNIPIMMLLVDKNLLVRKANRFAAKNVLRSETEMVGVIQGEALDCIHHEDDPQGCGFGASCTDCMLRKLIKKTFESRQNIENVETKFTSIRSGVKASFTYLVSTVFLTFDNEDVVLFCAQDISTRKQMERQLQQSHKMDAIGTLAGGIAHDFNNILSLVVGYTEMAQDMVASKDSPLHCLDKILDACGKARDLVQQILSFSRNSDVERIPVNISILITDWLKMVRSTLPATIDIIQDVDQKCGIVIGDPSQFQQIFMNLCTNAFQAMESTGGTLEVKLLKTHTILDSPQSLTPSLESKIYAELVISDTGPGIDEGLLNRIFDPYFTTKEKGKGTGVGLAVVQGIVKDYGGDIVVKSTRGLGTEFHVFLPLAGESVKKVKEMIAPPLARGSERILFVDDEPGLVEIGEVMLGGLGYRVTGTTNVEEALSLFTASPDNFDLIISDRTMPIMTGVQFVQRAKKIRANVPAILCTGFSTLISEEDALEVGISEYCLKPLDKRQLASAVRAALGS